jgi:hypothetical protein
MTLSITTVSIIMLSITIKNATPCIKVLHNNCCYALCHYAGCHLFLVYCEQSPSETPCLCKQLYSMVPLNEYHQRIYMKWQQVKVVGNKRRRGRERAFYRRKRRSLGANQKQRG